MEAPSGFGPEHQDFADPCLTTWLWCHIINWSGRRDSDSRPPPWQGGALPTELLPHEVCLGAESNHRHADFQSTALPAELPRHMATRKGLEPSTSSVTGWRTNQLYYRATFVNGNNRARTCDPLLVRQMLSQLSYAPTFAAFCCRFPRTHHRGDKRYNTLYRAFCQYLFSKKFRFFPRPPNRALRGVKARFHPAQSGCFQRLCIGSLKVSARENPVLLRRFAPPLCVSIGMSGVWFTPRSAFLLGCLAFGSRLLFAA